MRITIVTDVWRPQVNGVATTLTELARGVAEAGHGLQVIEPGGFRRIAWPGRRDAEWAWQPGRETGRLLDSYAPDALHIATEGPLGLAARRHALRRGWRFSTTFHGRWPAALTRALRLPGGWSDAWLRRFHATSSAVMVPTRCMLDALSRRRFSRLREWTRGVDLAQFRPVQGADFGLPRPVFLYVGRVTQEKNLQAFLTAELPGSKVVHGTGPLLPRLRARHPEVAWRGIVPREALAGLYSAADALVFPSRGDGDGLVMLEAMACGTPVAAFPLAGPAELLGNSGAGVLHPDLRTAALRALDVPRERALARARDFDWADTTRQFLGHLVPVQPERVMPLSQQIHKLAP